MAGNENKSTLKNKILKFRYVAVLNLLLLLPAGAMIRFVLFLFLFTLNFLYILQLFSRLTGIDMFSAAAWSLKSKMITRGRMKAESAMFPIVAPVCFLMAFIFFFLLLGIPSKVVNLKKNYICGLMEYKDSVNMIHIYDPLKEMHNTYYSSTSLYQPDNFKDVFSEVMLYKNPYREYYEEPGIMGIAGNLLSILTIAGFMAAVYALLYLMASIYNDENKKTGITHKIIRKRFVEISGITPGIFMAVALFFLLIIPAYSFISVKNLTGIYSGHKMRLRNELMRNVSPGKSVHGIVIQRYRGLKREEDVSYSDTRKRETSVRSYPVYGYTVKFSNLTEIPVYLNMEIYPGTEEANILGKDFTGEVSVTPAFFNEHEFTVNDDYSVSLKIDR